MRAWFAFLGSVYSRGERAVPFSVWVFLFVANAFFLFFRQFRTLPKPGHSTSKFIFRPYPALFKHLSPATRLQPK